ncbi:terminase large subunit [Bacillus wiedmannii]|uniref:Terminase large subunit n=1 Tax=Bacillus wiedmannii TaxID=1890302 RepID=A0ABX5DPL2_9BACI|nr:terminase TerL endonuclease subunit [Bacillus wiedmannii]PRT35494.1 terminase large subunit [Bacillus wiedmannii]
MKNEIVSAQNLYLRIYQYAIDIVDKKLPACKKHIRACELFLRDLNCIQDDKFEYYFDIEELYRFYKWSSMFKHTKGVLAGQKIELVDFQLFVVANIFCWKRKDNDRRKVKKVYIQLARKNAKSQLLAIICSYECFLSKEQQEVYIAGWGRDQSSLVYNEVLSQIAVVDMLKGKFTDSYGKITHIKSGSIIKPLSKEARKTGDGTNPGVSVIDEYHAHDTSEIYDVLISGMVARPEGLMVVITTAGFDLSKPCFTEYQYVSKILDPNLPVENEEYFVMICELDEGDDIKDERNWVKANPIVANYEEGLKFLRSELQIALDVPEKMRNFLTKNMNIWVDMKDSGYMDMSKWSTCGDDNLQLKDFEGCEAILGIDLSAKIDLTSLGIIIKTDKYNIFSHSFMPEDSMREKVKKDKVRYDLWNEQEYITTTPGSVVDYNFIKTYIKNLEEQYGIIIKEICYDPWNASQFAQDMEAEGYVMVEIRQGIGTLGEPTKNFREEVYSKNVIHDDNPVLSWATGNAITKEDHNGNIMLDKAKSIERIDPIASLINAHVRAMLMTSSEPVIEVWNFND